MEDDGIRAHLLQMLDRKSLAMDDIIQTLRTFYDNVDDEPDPAPPAGGAEERAPSQKEILAALISSLGPAIIDT